MLSPPQKSKLFFFFSFFSFSILILCIHENCATNIQLPKSSKYDSPEVLAEVQDDTHETSPRRCSIAASHPGPPPQDRGMHGDMCNIILCNSGCTYFQHSECLCWLAACRCPLHTWSFHNHNGNAAWSTAL